MIESRVSDVQFNCDNVSFPGHGETESPRRRLCPGETKDKHAGMRRHQSRLSFGNTRSSVNFNLFRVKHQMSRLLLITVLILYCMSRCSCEDLQNDFNRFGFHKHNNHLKLVRSLNSHQIRTHGRSINTCFEISKTVSVIVTDCVPCPLSRPSLCPAGTDPLSQGQGDRGCKVLTGRSVSTEITGCTQQCQLEDFTSRCCLGYWGHSCYECPGGASNPCNGRGRCQGNQQGSQCECDHGFTGVSCELCTRENVYGPNCDQECDCVYGICRAGSMGDGFCLCNEDYQGPRCDQAKTSCGEPVCHSSAICSPPVLDGEDPACVCSPGYSGDGRVLCIENDPCRRVNVCSPNASCTHTGPGRHTCECLFGYYGDGVECYPRNRCEDQHEICPRPSSKCIFDGPMQYHCECQDGYENYNITVGGCQRVDLCSRRAVQCPPHAVCVMVPDKPETRCDCLQGFRGDGRICYGTIMQTLRDLNSYPSGPDEGAFTSAISMLELTLRYLLSGPGFFTVFVPTDAAFQTADSGLINRASKDVDLVRHLMKLHIIPTYLDAFTLNTTRTVHTLLGLTAEVRPKEQNPDVLQYRLVGSSRRADLILVDVPASNGVIHIIDRVLYEPSPVESTPKDSVASVLASNGIFNHMQTLLESAGVNNIINPSRSYTILAPLNEAFNQLPDDTMAYLMSMEGRSRLLALLKNHIVQDQRLLIQDLITEGRFVSLHGATTNFHIQQNGLIQLDGGANITITDISASNGYIHAIDGLLVPLDIIPLVPRQCTRKNYSTELSPCSHCTTETVPTCANGSLPVFNSTRQCCLFTTSWNGTNVITEGCQIQCSREIWEPECCAGFYGQSCLPCPGVLATPCSGHGYCDDTIHGSGVCSCHDNFSGTGCESCRGDMYGSWCNQTCTCQQGICDSGPQGDGHCLGGCHFGFMGSDCDISVVRCGAAGHICHERAICDSSASEIRCVCQAGYSGSGLHCEPLDPCQLPERGGCHSQAFCMYIGPGLSDCTCSVGWQGDGFDCDVINPCDSDTKGGCTTGEVCAYIQPGESRCYCNHGYMRNGPLCKPINPCPLLTNGGCHQQADCVHTGPGTSDCRCREGYEGNGWQCYQSVPLEVATKPWLTKFHGLIQHAGMESFLATAAALTVFAPTDEAVDRFLEVAWPLQPHVAESFVRMHIVNSTYSERDLYQLAFGPERTIPTLMPSYSLQIQDCEHSLCVNSVPIELADILASNGLIHIVSEVLVTPNDLIIRNSFSMIAAQIAPAMFLDFRQLVDSVQTNSTIFSLLQHYGLVDPIDAADAYTVFLPSNEAVASFNASRVTKDILKYHLIIGQTLTPADIYSGMHADSSLGHNYQLRFMRDAAGSVVVNNIPVLLASQSFSLGIVYVIPEVLLVLQNRCDLNNSQIVQTDCGNCRALPDCPIGTTLMPTSTPTICRYSVSVPFVGLSIIGGCRSLCEKIMYFPECCEGFYGNECAECPGGSVSPCNNHGNCNDGNNGTGMCSCVPNYSGTACERCEGGRYGPLCDRVCSCVNGHCRNGPLGDGRCFCYEGFTGLQCDTPISEVLRCGIQCDSNAYCVDDQCVCYSGYTGNGSHCTAFDPCSEDGVCSEHASCHPAAGDVPACLCLPGYHGDGFYCEEVNPCLDGDDGGCHDLAECMHTGPAMSMCHCLTGYEGDGRTRCSPIDACRVNNGGCSIQARCTSTGPALNNCTCFQGHIGNGLVCIGNIAEELALNPNVSMFYSLLGEFRDVLSVLSSTGPLTILAPTNDAFNVITQQQINDWKRDNKLERIVMNHVIGCTTFNIPQTNQSISVGTLASQNIQIEYSTAEGVIVNYQAHIKTADLPTSNGLIHTIDKVLLSEDINARPDNLEQLPLSDAASAASEANYSVFFDLMRASGLLASYNSDMFLPVTVLMPTNQAFRQLYAGKLNQLRDPVNLMMLREYLGYHIIPNRKIHATQMAQGTIQAVTRQGSNVTIGCQQYQGFFLNQGSRIVDYETAFQDGVFYGLDMVLEPPSIGGRCDIQRDVEFSTECQPCSESVCPPGSRPSGEGHQECYYSVGWHDYGRGCMSHCFQQELQPNCCDQHYGPDCQVCPGGKRNPCSWHGVCDDGHTGTGQCRCDQAFTGVACELCDTDRFGPNCEECQCVNSGYCNAGPSGTGSCFCQEAFTGPRCETTLSVTPTCSPLCHVNAVCRPGNQCECRPKFYGNGYVCEVINQCMYQNGGCSMYAHCAQNYTAVTCRCRDNYEGDGNVCQPVDSCAVNNGDCHGNATCLSTGPNTRSCTCMPPFYGDGTVCVQSTGGNPSCSINNGGCDENADCHITELNPGALHPPDHEAAPQSGIPEGGSLSGHESLPSLGYTGTGGQVECKCRPGYVGTGYRCNGNSYETLASFPNLSEYFQALKSYASVSVEGARLVDTLKAETSKATLFIPDNSDNFTADKFTPVLIGNHVIIGQTYTKKRLTSGLVMTSWSGNKLVVSLSSYNKSVLINDVQVTELDIPSTNGVIHIVARPIDSKNENNRPFSAEDVTTVSASRIFAGILIGIFTVLVVVLGAGIAVFVVRYRRSRRLAACNMVSRYRVANGTDEGSVTFACREAASTEDSESDNMCGNAAFRSPTFTAADMDSDTVGFAELSSKLS